MFVRNLLRDSPQPKTCQQHRPNDTLPPPKTNHFSSSPNKLTRTRRSGQMRIIAICPRKKYRTYVRT
jgi:hypothetical protein